MRCDTCKHWLNDDKSDWESGQTGMGLCLAVRPAWTITESVEYDQDYNWEKFEAARLQKLQESRAYVRDGSEYQAVFRTGPDFFCALHNADVPERGH